MMEALRVLLLLPLPDIGQDAPVTDHEPASSCPALFGDADMRERNHSRREKRLRYVILSPYAIDIVHSARWDEPLPIEYEGLDLRETLLDPSRRVAIFELERELLGCPPGRYVVRVDHTLGEKAAVLAVLPHLVLIEREGRLRYITDGDATFTWRMTWASPWEFFLQHESSPAKKTRRRRPKRRR